MRQQMVLAAAFGALIFTTCQCGKSPEQIRELNNQLFDAAKDGDLKKINDLLRQGAEINAGKSEGMSALHAAIKADQIDAVRLLIEKGADVHATDYQKRTFLHVAAESGKEKSLRFLIRQGLDVNAKDKDGRTPLDCANADDVIEALLANGAQEGADVE